jgi:hypothetical protein
MPTSRITRLLLHFYERIQDVHEHETVDEVVQLVLDYFTDMQVRLTYPSEVADKVANCELPDICVLLTWVRFMTSHLLHLSSLI